jgi:hypothetical protein
MRRHNMTKVILSLLILALIAGMMGCVGGAGRNAKYDLTIASGEGGSVSVPGEGTFTCDAGRVIDLLAIPTGGYRFLKWTGSVASIANPNAASTTITVSGNSSIKANFEQTEATFYTLTVGVAGSGTTSPTPGQHTYAAGAVISISATAAGGYYFVNWTGGVGTIANVNVGSTTITMNGNYSITANFAAAAGMYYTLIMAATAGGSINPAVGQHSYAAGTVVPIIATAAGGYYFVNWTGSVGTIANVTAPSTNIIMKGNYSVTANFVASSTSTCTYSHLLLIYPNTDVTYVEDGVPKRFTGSMSDSLKIAVVNAFGNLPELIRDGSEDIVSSVCQTVEVNSPVTSISPLGDCYWLSPQDIEQDLQSYAPRGEYDSVHVVWYSGPIHVYWGLGGIFINDGTTTFSSLVAGDEWWWAIPSLGEPFLHEWLHGVCRFYERLEYPMPERDADGAKLHGYEWSPTEGLMGYYRDLMQGRVWEPILSEYTGITDEAWSRGTPNQ